MSPLRGSVMGVHTVLQRYHPYGVEEGPEHKSSPRSTRRGNALEDGMPKTLHSLLGVRERGIRPQRGDISVEIARL